MNPGKLIALLLAVISAMEAIGAVTLGPWQIRHPHPSDYNRDLVHDGKKFVLVDGYGHVFTSVSGRNWTLQNTPGLNPLRGVAFGETNFVAVGLDGVILSSPDATNWVSVASPTTNELLRITHNGRRFVAVGRGGTIVSSADGIQFVAEVAPTLTDLENVAAAPGRVLAVGERTVLVSTNAGEWKQALVTTTNYFADVTYFNGAYHNGYYASTNPMIWTNRVSGLGPSNVVAVASTTNRIARLLNGRIQWSSDGASWSTGSQRPQLYTLAAISNRFQLVGSSRIWFGDQFNFFTAMDSTLLIETNIADYFRTIVANPDGFAATDSLGRIFASKDAQAWRVVPKDGSEPLPNLDDLTRGELPWARCAGFSPKRVEVSDDGVVWQTIRNPESGVQLAATIGNTIVAAGTSNLWATTDRTNWTKIKTKEGPVIYVSDEIGGGFHEEKDQWILSFSRGNGMVVATTSWGELLFSLDGFEWQTEQTIFRRIDDVAIAAEKLVVAAWGVIAEARLDGGVDPVRQTKLRLSSNQLELEGPVRYHEIQAATNFSAWNFFFKTAGTNTTLQIDQSSEPMQFFRAVRPD
jgi:hypothetical protein